MERPYIVSMKSKVNEQEVMEDVNYFLNFCKDEKKKLSDKYEDDIYMVLKMKDNYLGMKSLMFMKDINNFNSNIIEGFLSEFRHISEHGVLENDYKIHQGADIVLNEDYSISIMYFIPEYEIGYVTKKSLEDLKLKLATNINDEEKTFRVGDEIYESIKYEKFYLSKDNSYYRLLENKENDSSLIEIERKDIDVLENFVEQFKESDYEYCSNYLLEVIKCDYIGKNEVISNKDIEEMEDDVANSEVDYLYEDVPF